MPEVRNCRKGCSESDNYLCQHRFGSKTSLICEQGRLSFTRLSDLQVLLDFLYIIHQRWHKRRVLKKRYYTIVTHDVDFVRDARLQQGSQKNMRGLPITWGADWAQFGYGKDALRIHVQVISGEHANGERDLIAVLKYARSLRRS